MVSTQPHAEQTPLQSVSFVGRDEMNLAEFPIALLADRVPKGQKTLYFEDAHGRLTITGSDAYGLPTAIDTDVIVALIYLTKQRNDFRGVKVNFSRYELIQLLNWPDDGKSYKRLDQSFNRWGGVWMVYNKCWWDNKSKKYVSAKMHILESVVIAEAGGKTRNGQSDLPLSTFTWNQTFIESCQADNLRQLNLDTYFSLNSAISKRLYRFLGKRFYFQADHTFDLGEIAFDRVGLSRTYEGHAGKIKEKLQPAIDELESIGFLQPLSRDERYCRVDRGQWTIRLVRSSPALAAPPPSAAPEPTPLAAELVKRGVTKATADKLVQRHQAGVIEAQLEAFDWLMRKKPEKIGEPGGYLVDAIKQDYAAPKGFTSKAEQQKRQEARRAEVRKDAEDRRLQRAKDAEEAADRQRVDAYLEQLSPDERRALEADALAQAGPDTKSNYASPEMALFRDTLMLMLLREYLGPKLRQEPLPAVEA
jgi:hypothetical protein